MKRTRIIHPFLFALFPILALYSYNIRSIPVSGREVAAPLVLSFVSAVVLYFILRVALGNAAKAGLTVTLLVLWFFSFGHLAGLAAVWTEGIYNRSLCFASLVLTGLAAFLVVRSRRSFAGITRFLNIVSATLVMLNLVSIAQTVARRPHIVLDGQVRVSRSAAARPNIYYIVLDAYTRADILQEVFGHDNSGFVAALEARGFVVASGSSANYNLTHQSLASSLNFSYLDDLARDVGWASADREPLYEMIKKNQVMAFLKSQGYRLITASSSIEPTDIRTVDLYVGFKSLESEFRMVLLNTTPLPLFFRLEAGASPYDAHRSRLLNAFRALADSPDEKGPFFFFVHLMSPHPPFVFGRNGEAMNPDYPFSMVDADRLHGANESKIRRYIPAYRDQLSFLNSKILDAVDAILSRSPELPIIIIQGDHGSRAYADLDRPEASYFKENLAILNAFHMPGKSSSLIYPGISPVNTFRLVFRHYFGADLALLEDKSSWTTWRKPYRFIPFDERSYSATLESVRDAMKPSPSAVQQR